MYDIILKKRNGGELSEGEIQFVVNGVTADNFPNEQIAALLMAIYFKGMTKAETLALTLAMAHSGETADLSGIPGIKVDKHSTGGVGDKTTLIVTPIVAACGVPVAKMSGRGLGHTGGTVDKLASIPGFSTELSQEEFIRIVNETGLCVAGQSGNLAPADKKLYALRDITGTVENISLIASSIMSKKLAAGADRIVLDVKYGSGAFMGTSAEAVALAEAMVDIGEGAGKGTVALITDMNRPLGCAIGNSLEIAESVEILTPSSVPPSGKEDLYEICMVLSAHMLNQAGKGTLEECRTLAENAIASGMALQKLQAMVTAQGGDSSILSNSILTGSVENGKNGLPKFSRAKHQHLLISPSSGYIQSMDTQKWGIAAMMLGAGRERIEDEIDYSAGIILHKKPGTPVKEGESIAEFHTNQTSRLAEASAIALEGITITTVPPEKSSPLIYAQVDKYGTHYH